MRLVGPSRVAEVAESNVGQSEFVGVIEMKHDVLGLHVAVQDRGLVVSMHSPSTISRIAFETVVQEREGLTQLDEDVKSEDHPRCVVHTFGSGSFAKVQQVASVAELHALPDPRFFVDVDLRHEDNVPMERDVVELEQTFFRQVEDVSTRRWGFQLLQSHNLASFSVLDQVDLTFRALLQQSHDKKVVREPESLG